MPHTARNWEPGAIYHIDLCAHDGAPIFATDEDRAFFVRRAARIFAEEGQCSGRGHWPPGDLIRPACELTKADEAALRAGRKTRAESRARAIAAHVAVDYVVWPTNEVASALGVSGSAVVQARRRGATLLQAACVSAEEIVRRSRTGSRNCGS